MRPGTGKTVEIRKEKVLSEAKINNQSQAYDEAIKPDPEPDFNEL